MKALEAELQVRMFEPSGRSVRLTPIGEEVVAAARVALDDIDHVVAVARAHVGSPDPLVIVTTPTLEPLFTRHFLPAYLDHHPDRSARILRAGGREEVVVAAPGRRGDGRADRPPACPTRSSSCRSASSRWCCCHRPTRSCRPRSTGPTSTASR